MAVDHRHRVEQAAGPQGGEEPQGHADRDGEGHGGEDQLQRRPDADADQLGHRLARAERDAEVAGGDVGDVLGEAQRQRVVQPHFLAHAFHHRRVDGRAAVLAHAGDEAPRQDAEQQEHQRDDGEEGRDDVEEAASENEQHRLGAQLASSVDRAPALPNGERSTRDVSPVTSPASVSSTQRSSLYWCVISVGFACRPWIHG